MSMIREYQAEDALQKAEAFARGQGAAALQIGVLAANTGAVKLYQRQGFQAYEVLLTKSLQQSGR